LTGQYELPPFSAQSGNTLTKVRVFLFIGSFQGLQLVEFFAKHFLVIPKIYNALTIVPVIRIRFFYTPQAMAKIIFQNVLLTLRTTRVIPPFIELYTETVGMETMATAKGYEGCRGEISRILNNICPFIGRVDTQLASVVFLGHAGN
jgi:hypothetical protein